MCFQTILCVVGVSFRDNHVSLMVSSHLDLNEMKNIFLGILELLKI